MIGISGVISLITCNVSMPPTSGITISNITPSGWSVKSLIMASLPFFASRTSQPSFSSSSRSFFRSNLESSVIRILSFSAKSRTSTLVLGYICAYRHTQHYQYPFTLNYSIFYLTKSPIDIIICHGLCLKFCPCYATLYSTPVPAKSSAKQQGLPGWHSPKQSQLAYPSSEGAFNI